LHDVHPAGDASSDEASEITTIGGAEIQPASGE